MVGSIGSVRRLALCAAGVFAVVLLLCAGSAQATTATKHHLTMYKVAKHLDLEGDFPGNTFHEHVSCKPGDYAVDGMWRIDRVDQAQPQAGEFGDERDVQIDASYGDDADIREWHFRGVNNASGNAQLKLIVTCLGGKTAVNGHRHDLQVSARFDVGHASVASGPFGTTHPTECAPDEIAVAPGFNVTAGSARVFRNYPTASFRGWQWAFVVGGPSDLTVHLRCLKVKTAAAGSGPHAHELRHVWRPGYAGSLRNLATSMSWETLDCDELEKGLVGAFWIDDPFHVWYLGMDPRIKSRAFRFWNDGGGSGSVYVAALCMNDRVGKGIKP